MNTCETSVNPTLSFIGGGSTGETTAEYLNALEAAIANGELDGVKDITAYAIVGEADDGSRTGDLRTLYGINPVGDVRRSISALSDPYASHEFEARFGEFESLRDALTAIDAASERLTAALSYTNTTVTPERMAEIAQNVRDMSVDIYDRDPKKLKGLSLGHIVLAALAVEHDDFETAVHEANQLMDTRAEVIPASVVPHRLVMWDGEDLIVGEHNIDEYVIKHPDDVKVELSADNFEDEVVISSRALAAIKASCKAVVGPGSVYTSIVPALLPEGMSEALIDLKNRGGDLSIVGNLVTEPTETEGWPASRYVDTAEKYAGTKFTEVVLNDNTASLPEDRAVRFDRDEFKTRADLRVHAIDLVKDEDITHDPNDEIAHTRSKAKHTLGKAVKVLTPAAALTVEVSAVA